MSRQELLIGRGTRGCHDRAYQASDDPQPPTGGPLAVDYDAVYPMIANPLPDHPGRHAGPTFEWTEP